MIVLPGQRLVDYAAPNKDPASIKAQGFVGAIRYICDSPTNWKHVTLAERDVLLGAGLGLSIVWETTTVRPLSGRPAGLADGATARARLQWLGYPADVPVLFAFDTDITKATLPAATAYGRAFREAVGRPVVPYGDTDIGDALADISEGTWLPNASSWSRLWAWLTGGNEHVVVKQRKTDMANGWDPNDVVRPFTMWSKQTPPPVVVEAPPAIEVNTPNQPAPTPTEEELATVHVTVEGRNAEFWTQAPIVNGQPHILFVAWSGPGGPDYDTFTGDHHNDGSVVEVHTIPGVIQRDWILLGNPQEIQDSTWAWSKSDFRCVTG